MGSVPVVYLSDLRRIRVAAKRHVCAYLDQSSRCLAEARAAASAHYAPQSPPSKLDLMATVGSSPLVLGSLVLAAGYMLKPASATHLGITFALAVGSRLAGKHTDRQMLIRRKERESDEAHQWATRWNELEHQVSDARAYLYDQFARTGRIDDAVGVAACIQAAQTAHALLAACSPRLAPQVDADATRQYLATYEAGELRRDVRDFAKSRMSR